MYNIKTQNKITQIGLDIFESDLYNISEANANPDAIIVRSAEMKDYNFNPELKAIARAGAGYNNIPVEKCAEAGIVVFNTPGANANAVKELTVAALMLASRDIYEGINWAKSLSLNEGLDIAKEVESGKSKFAGFEIANKTLGVFGMGKVGGLTANAGISLNMQVLGYDPYMTIDTALSLSRSVNIAKNLVDIFEKSDYIALHAPVTKETKNIINAEKIAKMKDGVRIINMSRADLVDDNAMAQALESGKVAKYITDFPNENVLKMQNVVPIPHLGASTQEAEDNCAVMAVNQLKDFLENGNIKNSVNYPDLVMERGGNKRVCVLHKNIAGIIALISSEFSGSGINIENMANKSRGDYAYTICDINLNGELPESFKKKLESNKGVIKTMVIG